MRFLPVLLFAVLNASFAGCLDSKHAQDQVPPADLVAHDSSGPVDLPAGAAWSAAIVDAGRDGYEPTLGVDSAGTIFATAEGGLAKSEDEGRTWTALSPPHDPFPNLDPYVWVDPLTDRVFSAPLYVACTNLAWSDDGGASWEGNAMAGCGIPAHDHQSLSTGPPPAGVTTSGYPNVVYYSYNSFRYDGTWVVPSLDGGRTWGLGAPVSRSDTCHIGLNGAPAVGGDGTVYVPMARCEGLRVGVSKDAGATWATHDINDVGMLGMDAVDETLAGRVSTVPPPYTGNPGAGVDSSGNAFVAYPGADGRMYVTRSTDGGSTWSAPVVASPPQVRGTAFSTLVAGDAGRIALAYLGTESDPTQWRSPSPQHAPPETRWDLYVTLSLDALAADPVFQSLQATPDDDPVQLGCIWLGGGASDCRNLGDFIDITEHRGRAFVAFADGCRACSTASESTRVDLTLAMVDEPLLRSAS